MEGETCQKVHINFNLPVISKIMERIVYDRLYDYLTISEILSKSRFVFRKFLSTATEFLDRTNGWYVNLDKKKFNLVFFVNLKKGRHST